MQKTINNDLAQEFIESLTLIHNNFFRRASIPIPPNQFAVLIRLRDTDALSITELSSLLNISKQQMSIIIEKLVAQKLVRKTPSMIDRRAIQISLTAEGIAVLNAHEEHIRQIIIERISKFTEDELMSFKASLHLFNTNLSKIFRCHPQEQPSDTNKKNS